MRKFLFFFTVLVAMSAIAMSRPALSDALSENNFGAGMVLPRGDGAASVALQDMRTTGVPSLPSPQGDDGRTPSYFLQAAQSALAAGRTGEAQQALEMAQTRLLDRSVPIGQTNNPSDDPLVRQTSQALQALAARDRRTCMQLIESALGTANARGL